MIKNIIIYILLGACALFSFNNWRNQRAINTLTEQNTTLASDLKAQITFTPKRQIIYKTRTVSGEVKTVIKYLPPEGSATIEQSSDGENIELRVNALGLTFRPALVGLLGQKPEIGLGTRLFYWNRYGAGVGFAFSDSEVHPFGFIDRRIDDIIPFMHNSAVGSGIEYSGGSLRLSVMLNVYF